MLENSYDPASVSEWPYKQQPWECSSACISNPTTIVCAVQQVGTILELDC